MGAVLGDLLAFGLLGGYAVLAVAMVWRVLVPYCAGRSAQLPGLSAGGPGADRDSRTPL